jgi:hypothetical protein
MFSSFAGGGKHKFHWRARRQFRVKRGDRFASCYEQSKSSAVIEGRMFENSSWWDALALSVLNLLIQIEAWHLIAAGLIGAALCVVLGRAATLGLVGATLCGAVAIAAAATMWRSQGPSDRVVIVTASTVAAPGGDDLVEWKIDAPYSIFLASRRSGGLLWIDGIQIHAKNLSDRPLRNLTAVLRPNFGQKEIKLQLVLADRQVSARESQSVPPDSEFSLLYLIPAMSGGGAPGLPAGQFLHTFGDLHFTVRYDTNQMFARLISADEEDRQLAQLEQEVGNGLPASPSRKP